MDDLHRLRALLRRIATKLAGESPLGAREIAELNTFVIVPAKQTFVQRQNGLHLQLEPVKPGWPWVLSRIAASLADVLTQDQRRRIKTCANDACRWVYYDQTKGNIRRWCNDRTCGNRDRVRRSRALHKN